MVDLSSIFATIPLIDSSENTAGGSRFLTSLVPGHDLIRVARDGSSCPVIMIASNSEGETLPLPPISLQHIDVRFDSECRLHRTDGAREHRQFTIMRCQDSDPAMREHFLRIMGAVVPLFENSSTRSDVESIVLKLVELFRSLSVPPSTTGQGLWAELFVISQSTQPKQLVEAWRTNIHDRHDFASTNERIEVKSSSKDIRKHHFSLEQLTKQDGVGSFVASVLLERKQSGTSIVDLMKAIAKRLASNAELIFKLEQVVGITLGNEWKNAAIDRYDEKFSRQSLRFYHADTVPCVGLVPDSVSEVRFASDLSGIPSIVKSDINESLFPMLVNALGK
jgi:hypothetical protein